MAAHHFPRRSTSRITAAILLIVLTTLLAPALPPAAAAPAPTDPPEAPVAGRFNGRTLLEPGGFLSDPAPGDAEQIARDFIAANRKRLGLTAADLAEMVLVDRYTTTHNGVTHLYFRQHLSGIALFNGDININITRDGRVLNLGNGFEPDLAAAVTTAAPAVPPIDAIRKAAAGLRVPVTEAILPITQAQGVGREQLFTDGGVSLDPIPVELIYQRVAPGDVRLAWQIVLRLPNNVDWWNLRVDTLSGAILSQVNYSSESGTAGVEFVTDDFTPAAPQPPPLPQSASPANAADGSTYRVYDLPLDSPLEGGRTLVDNPADPTASPFGWHDTDGAAGADHTITRGNNAFAYGDSDFNGAPDGDEPVGGPTLSFDFPAPDFSDDPTTFPHPSTYRAASIVNAFYITNRIHDILFHLGFDEAAGNFQAVNYSGQGQGNDAVNVEVQDGPATLNANFSTPPDGTNGRMQLYLGGSVSRLTVNAPISIAGSYSPGTATFGTQIFNVSGELVMINDNSTIAPPPSTGTVTDGCQPAVNNIVGKIVLIDRGGCNFSDKARNAQNGGAVGVITANNAPGDSPSMGAIGTTGDGITIPVLSVTNTAGTTFKTALLSDSVTLTMTRGNPTDVAFDNGVILHEYGHGLSTRLGGGPSNSACVRPFESGSEGWSDFVALALTAKPNDTPEQARGIGLWMSAQPADGRGIRTQPYSTDLAVNSLTYDDIKTRIAVHDIGEIWAITLWEVHWALVAEYGFDADLINGAGGNRLALQLVVDGLKLQPCEPTFVEMRDAILAADVAGSNGANQCLLWEAFAKRGLGYSAEAGTSASVTDGIEAFDLPSACTLQADVDRLAICLPNPIAIDISLGASFAGPIVLSADGLPPNTTPAFSANPVNTLGSSTLTIATSATAPGRYTLNITGAGPDATYQYPVELFLAAEPPGAATLTTPVANATNVFLAPTLSWAPTVLASAYRLEVAREPTFTDPLVEITLAETSYTLTSNLDSAGVYYWRVTPLNGCGSAPTGATAQFTTRDQVDLLLVDDSDRANGSLARYQAALDALTISYDIWEGNDNNDEPPLSVLRSYRTVLWFTGYNLSGAPTPESETTLASWLDSGRCLMLSSQELFARREMVTPFMRDYLGVDSAIDDSRHTAVSGIADTFTDALGPFTLTYAAPMNNYSDHLVPRPEAATVLTGDGAAGGGAAIAKAGTAYQTFYMGFPAEALAPSDLQALLGAALAWCDELDIADLGLTQAIDPLGSILLPGQPFTYTLTLRNDGDAAATGVQLALTLPPQLTDLTFTTGGPVFTQTGTSTWDVGDLPPDASGTLTIQGRISSDLAAGGEVRIEAALTGTGLDLNSTNQRLAATVRYQVPTVAFNSATANGSEGSATELQVNMSAPNPYSVTQVNYTVSGGTASPGADYTLAVGPLSIPAGATEGVITLTALRDAATDPGETVLVSLAAGGGVALGAPTGLIVTITDVPMGEIVASATELSVLEGGPMVTYTLTLDRAPEAEVTITLIAGAQLSLSPTLLVFTPENWNVPQTVGVGAVDDTAVEGAHTAEISYSLRSADPRFDAAIAAALPVRITDNDGSLQATTRLFLPLITR